MKNLKKFKIFGLPLYVGISRKRMIYHPLGITAEEALTATSALNLYALQKGADLLRVHDVKEAKQMINLWKMLK
jgi:dihydropteroate synthase